MSIVLTADGAELEQCDGCGRTDQGPGSALDVREYTVFDPNIGTAVRHHYCPSCSYDRNGPGELLDFGWQAAPVPEPDEAEAPRRRR